MDQESAKDRNYTAHPEYEKHHHNNAGQETYNKSTPPPNGELLTAPKNDSRAPPNKESHPSPNNGSQPAPNDNNKCDKDKWSPRPLRVQKKHDSYFDPVLLSRLFSGELSGFNSELQPLLISTQDLPPTKRMKTHSAPCTQTADLEMDDYLALCHILPSDTVTRDAIDKHLLYHWSIFKKTSIRRLCKLGIPYGPAVLLTEGVHEATKRLNQASE